MRMTTRLIATLALFIALAGGVRAEVITLRDGRVLHVKVLRGDDRGVEVQRLDNHGKLFIRWPLLLERDSKRLRIQFGLEEDEAEADLLMPGHRLYPRLGDYYDGLVESSTQTKIVFLREGKRTEYRREAVRKYEPREVSIFDVYTPEELYAQRKVELAPTPEDVTANFELARWATRIDMYDKAIEHYLHVQAADPEHKVEYIKNQLTRLEVLDKNKEIQSAVRQAVRSGRARNFAKSLVYFEEILAVSDLDAQVRADVEKKKARVEAKRWAHFSKLVRIGYYREMENRIKAKSRGKDIYSSDKEAALSIDKALSWLRSKLHKEVIAGLAAKLNLDPKNEVEKMWKARNARSTRTASYGSGTFVIQGKKEIKVNKNAQQAQNLRQRFGGRGRNQQQQQQQPKQPKLLTKQQWWKSVDSTARAFFMRAWYAEKGKQLEVVNLRTRGCQQCGSTGTKKALGGQGGMVVTTCVRCQGNRGDRIVVYR